MKKVTTKKTRSVNNRPNCLKITKGTQKVNFTTVTDKDGNEVTILDVLKTTEPDFAEEIYKNDNIKLLKEYMNILTPRERDVLTKRYGLYNNDEIT